jgi:hypothetical protein
MRVFSFPMRVFSSLSSMFFNLLDHIELSPLDRLTTAWKRCGSSRVSVEYLADGTTVQADRQPRLVEPAGAGP